MNISKISTKILSVTMAISFVTIVFVANIAAQIGTSSISGTVTDQNGAVVPGATITLSNPATGFNRTDTSGENGKYSFPGIPPATYRIEVTAATFKKLVNTNVKALVDSTNSLNLVLQLGDVSAVVDVTSGTTIESVINTQDASLGNNFEPQQITQLPTDLRRVADLLTLQPGVTREGYVAGGRSDQANVTLDGVDINDQQNGGREDQFQTSQDTVLRATAESVEEFRITTTNANASQGRSSGAQISLVTKSGTNNFRGAVFYFRRPTKLSANDFFNNAAGTYDETDQAVIDGFANAGDQRAPRPSLARNLYGGAIGGPIKKDKLFFFYSYEAQRQTLGTPVVRVVPLPSLGQGKINFHGTGPSCVGGNCTVGIAELNNSIYPMVGINPIAVAALNAVATSFTANDTSDGDGLNTGAYRFNSPTTTEENTHIARIDYKINDSQGLYFRANYQSDVLGGTSRFPDTPSTTFWDHPWGFVLAHDWAISSNKVNNFRYGLTRQAFSQQGDTSAPTNFFRFVYEPRKFVYTLDRITPTHNITDDFTLIKGKHTWQFGGNVRIIRNKRTDFGNAFDSAVMNPSFYELSGAVLTNAFENAGYVIDEGDISSVQAAATALIGRYSQYSGNFTFDKDGSVLDPGTPTNRNFSTEEYDAYVQDIWKPTADLTLTLGLRYGISRPVYEKNGFEVVPTEPLGHFFERRKASAAQGIPMNDLISFERGGPANNGPGFYKLDKNNWQPRLAAAWSPNFEKGFWNKLFGGNHESVIRGGFAMTNDHFGGQLAVSFDALSSIGFTSSTTISANTYNVTDRPAPLFTGFDQNIRSLPGIPVPVQRFSTDVTPECLAGLEDCPQRIESSLDGTIISPTHYTWNVSYGRKLPKGMYFEASYIGRKARNLLAARDVNALNDLVDPGSGMDWYTAAGKLHDLRESDTPVTSVPNIPFFDHYFPGIGGYYSGDGSLTPTQEVFYLVSRQGYDILDWTYVQSLIDDIGIMPNLFFHPQYAAFSAFSSVAYSDYQGATFSLRQRLGSTLTYDINYTLSESKDNASGLQTGSSYGSQFILNSLRPDDNYAYSDFDTRHSLNANFIFELPFGKGRRFGSGIGSAANSIIGGWQLSGVYRYNSALPIFSPFDAAQWATNWNAQSSGTRIRPLQVQIDRNTQNAFADPQAAFNSYRNARPGETGERNVLRGDSYSTIDLGLTKSFTMPWRENHKLSVRFEVFNVANSQSFNADNFTRTTFGLPQDPETGHAASTFGKIFTSIQGTPRRVQFGLRYSF